jgi:hypothetical protein
VSLTTYQICALLLGGAVVGSVSTVSVSRLTPSGDQKAIKENFRVSPACCGTFGRFE